VKLLDIDFGPVTDASGVRGFFGEGYPFHRPLKPFGLDLSDSTFVSKTATLNRRTGWLLYREDGITPDDLFPQCVIIKWRKGVVLNAIGLGNLSLLDLLLCRSWQSRIDPFFISLMPLGETPQQRMQEFIEMIVLLVNQRGSFRAPFGLQINLSCANTGLDTCPLVGEASEFLDVASHHLPGVPLMPKFSAEVSPEAVLPVTRNVNCHAICVSNAVHWGALPDRIDWHGLFGQNLSPLHVYGGGALSGAPLLPIVVDWILKARAIGIDKPINASGGILSVGDAQALFVAGADSVALGTVAMLRPWRVRGIIRAVHSWI